jgi:prolipoprotein diacylglyceryltransferase
MEEEQGESGGVESGLAGKRGSGRWLDELAWYLVVMGFIIILLAGLCFFLYRNHPLRYEDYSIDANALGKYLLIAGLLSYVGGRVIYYTRKMKRRREG